MEENENSNGSLGVLPSPSLSAYVPPPRSHMTEVSRETNQNGVLGTSRVCPSRLCFTGIFLQSSKELLESLLVSG